MSFHNNCGDCNVCCKRFSIPEIKWMGDDGKPKDILCDKYCDGCTIYENRPPVCADYECLWLKVNKVNNSLSVNLRPDKCNVMVTARNENNEGQLVLDEVEENSFDPMNMTPDQQELLNEIVKLVEHQTIPVGLYVRSYDWKLLQINIQMEQTIT